MNDGYDDQIFDAFLEESLTNQRPPDLTELIQQRLREELGPERFQQLRSGGLRAGATRVATASPANDASCSPVRTTAGQSLSARSAIGVAVLALAAGLLLAVSVWKVIPGINFGAGAGSVAVAPTQPAGGQVAPKRPPRSVPPAPTSVAQELPLPFSDEPQLPELYDPMPAEIAQAPAQMSSDEIGQWLDERFNKLWSDRQLVVSQPVDAAQLMDRMSRVLAGQNAAASAQSPSELAEKLVRTVSFSENWSDRIATYWLRGTPAADARHPAGQALRGYLAQQIVAKKPWNEVLSELIDAQPDQPQAVFLASLAGGDNHRLASRIGGVLLDEALACARCHDPSDNGRVVSLDQDDYWSLVALFTGVDGQATSSDPKNPQPVKHVLVDKQPQLYENGKSPSVYFERPDRRQQAARYRLPGGDYWRTIEGAKTPRQSLARWISNSTVTDQATVNLAWRLVFGRPLTAQHTVLDGEGYAQRREIVAKLASQFHAHNRDFGLLVTWLVNSRPFASPGLDIDRARWLAADEQEIGSWRVAATNFATFVPGSAHSLQLPSLQAAVAQIDTWSNSRGQDNSLLAQPTPEGIGRPKVTVPAQPIVQEPSATYLIRSIKPTDSQSRFISRLVASKLTWDQQVDHIAGLIGEAGGNAELHRAAKKLLDHNQGDRSEALFQLLQSALVCHESL